MAILAAGGLVCLLALGNRPLCRRLDSARDPPRPADGLFRLPETPGLGLRQNNGDHWSFVWNEFTRQFGAKDSKRALSGFATWIKGLQGHARRPLQHHQPGCPCLCADEVSLICLVAACQHHQPRRARNLAEWMVEPGGAGELLEAAIRPGGKVYGVTWIFASGKNAWKAKAKSMK